MKSKFWELGKIYLYWNHTYTILGLIKKHDQIKKDSESAGPNLENSPILAEKGTFLKKRAPKISPTPIQSLF